MTTYSANNPVPMEALPATAGVVQQFRVAATNDGPSTYAPDGLDAAPIFGLGGQQLQGNEIVEGGIATLVSFVGALLNSGDVCWVLLSCDSGAQQVGTGVGSSQASTVGQVQTGTLVTAVAAGTPNALTAFIPSTLSSLVDAQPAVIIAAAANSAPATLALTLGETALQALPIVKGNNQPLNPGDIPRAGYPVELNFSAALNAFVMQNPVTGISVPVAVVGDLRSLKATVSAASASITFTADQIVVAPSLNGVPSLLSNFNQTFDGTKTGLGGMDTGSLPISSFVAFYAALTASGQAGIFGTNASSLVGNVYGGMNLPNGVVATALIGVWPTNATGQLKVASQRGRSLSIPVVVAFTTNTVSASPTMISLTVIPPNAVSCRGSLLADSTATSSMSFNVGTDSTAVGMMGQQSTGGTVQNDNAAISNAEWDLATPQTLWYEAFNTFGTPTFNIDICQYRI